MKIKLKKGVKISQGNNFYGIGQYKFSALASGKTIEVDKVNPELLQYCDIIKSKVKNKIKENKDG
ncbi:MAG: hypothetical protein ACE5D7_11235 [Fidelibacterota bacterium]